LYQEQIELIDQVVALLRDPDVGVRRAAMLAVARAEQVGDESLLPALHDPDAEVRRLCEEALRNRGLGREHIELGRLLTDPRPATRLRVLDHLPRVRDIDPALWLRRLTHDPVPAVRVAAVRVISEQAGVDLSDRLDQMARSDPSPTVCQLAGYYLRRARPGQSERTEP
jgi:HEAT repeat protein